MRLVGALFLLLLVPESTNANEAPTPSTSGPPALTAAQKKNILKLRDGLYHVLRQNHERQALFPLAPGERLLINDFHFLEPQEREEPSYVVLATSPSVSFLLASKPDEDTEKDSGKPRLQLQLAESQKNVLAEFTRANLGQPVAVVIDGEIVTIHKVKSVITEGKLQIVRCTKHGCETLFSKLLNDSYEPTSQVQ